MLSSTHGTLSRIDHVLGHETNLNQFTSIIISNIFSDQNGMKLGINHREKWGENEHMETKQHVTKTPMSQ